MVRSPGAIARPSLIAAAIATAIGGSSPLYAQERSTVIEEIIVTARKTEESIQETPISIAAFSTRDLEKLGAYEAGDVGKYTPNVRIQKQTSSQDNYAFSIRGVSSGETSLSVEPTVGLYQDGIYIARSTGAAFDIADLQRIEVLRGPQGTLFGRNTIGGAINVITEKPRGELAFKQFLSAGNRGYFRSQTTIDTPKVGDFSAKLSYLYTEKEQALKSIYTGGTLGEAESEAWRLAVRWTPTDTLTIDYAYDKSDRENQSSLEQLSFVRPLHVFLGGPAYAQAAGFSSDKRLSHLPVSHDDKSSDSDIDGSALTVEWQLAEDTTFKSITSYREWKSGVKDTDFGSIVADGATLFDLDASLISIGTVGTPTPVPTGTIVPLFGASRESAQHQWTQEFQLVGTLFDERLTYNTGLYYFREKANEFNPQQLLLPTTIALASPPASVLLPLFPANGFGTSVLIRQPFFKYSTDNESWAAYGQFTYAFTPEFDVSLGLRYTIDDKETTLRQNFRDIGLATITDDDNWANFSPSVTFKYQWSDEISTYFKVASGYRAGGYNARSTTVDSFRSPVDEEELISYELGIKSDLLDRSLRINAALFHLEYTDRQIAQFEAGSGGASTRIVNAGESTTDGLELDITYIPLPGLKLMLNYGWLDVEYQEFITGVVDPVTGFPEQGPNSVRDISDNANENLYAPEHTAAFIAEYEFEPWSFGQFSMRADVTYSDEFTFHPQFTLYDRVDDYYLVNARATLADIPAGKDGRLRIAAWGKNLENKHYREFGIDFGSLGFAVNTYGELRSWGIDVTYEFNR